MANAAGSKGSRGDVAPSQQGRAGLRLQNALPDARVLYVSATGATTLAGLAYAQRLGLWGTDETPFEKRTDFVSAMESGGVAAMEVVARDLKALGLYQARALSYDGVEVELLEHPLTPEQRAPALQPRCRARALNFSIRSRMSACTSSARRSPAAVSSVNPRSKAARRWRVVCSSSSEMM